MYASVKITKNGNRNKTKNMNTNGNTKELLNCYAHSVSKTAQR